ncbi:serine/threonine-protein kinase [Streptomyces hebeiensis]
MGEVFAGRYELIDPIGRGGVGAVWRAWDYRRRRYVAAKVLQQSDAHTLLRFVREQALRIDHPHVLAPASWAADDDKVLFTMDLVSGGSLAHLIGDYGPLPPRFVCTLLDQLLAGLSAVHAEGVVHRDIKPANILLESTGTARPHLRLSDFGISMRKGEPRLTETNYVVGTPGYFAPEQLMGAEPDFPADLFATGLVALYLLQGAKPDSQALVELFVSHGTPGAPQGIPEPLWQVLAALLQPDPHARFRTATGARKALATAVEMLPEPSPEEEPVEVFDQIGPLPPEYGPSGPLARPKGGVGSGVGAGAAGAYAGPYAGAAPGSVPAAPTDPRTGPPSDPRAERTDGAYAPLSAPVPPFAPSPAPAPDAMSDTGSFHLPPPPERRYESSLGPASAPTPTELAHAHAPTAAAPVRPGPDEPAPTRPYTAERPRTLAHHASSHIRPGPPPKVAIPVLLVALVCFAVGIWALTQI